LKFYFLKKLENKEKNSRILINQFFKLTGIKKTKIIPNTINVGGGFPSVYPDLNPEPLINYMEEIKKESLLKLNEIGIDSFKQINFNIDPKFVSKNYDKHRLLRLYGVFLQTKKNMTCWHQKPRQGAIKKKYL